MIIQKVIWDLDNTKAKWSSSVVRFLNDNFPDMNFTAEDITTYDFWDTLPNPQAREAVLEFLRTPGFFRNLEPHQGSVDAFNALIELGHNLTICTTPHWECIETSKQEKSEWVEFHLGTDHAERIIFSKKKHKVEADVIIDDNPRLTYRKRNIQFKNWLIVDQPYNRVLTRLKHKPVGRIFGDWSNWEEEFQKLKLI